MSSASGELVRALGPCEIYSSSRHALGFYKCVANTCQYSVTRTRLGHRAIRDVLEVAVANVVLAIPSLAVGIVGQDTSSPWFVQLPSINIRHHIDYLDEANLEDPNDSALLGVLEKQHAQAWFDIEQRPPWKLIVIVNTAAPDDNMLIFDAVFAVHHAIADGRSTAAFHTRLLRELSRPPQTPMGLSSGILNTTCLGKPPPPQEQLVVFSTSWRFLAQTLFRELAPAWLQRHRSTTPWTGGAITREPCRTLLRLVAIPAAAVPRVLAACRRNNTTLTSLLHALALTSFAKRVATDEALAFRSATPIDLRPFIKNSAQAGSGRELFGVYVTAQSHTFDERTITALRNGPGAAELWDIAANLRLSTRQHLDDVPKDDIMSMLGWITDWPKFWLSKVGMSRQDTWEVSNIGSMPSQHGAEEGARGDWSIQRSIMSQGATVAGAAVSISVAGVTGHGINIMLGWQEGIVETKTIDGLASDLQRWLDRIGRGYEAVIES